MGIITKEVEVKLTTNNVEHYKSFGYQIPMKKTTKSSLIKYKKEFVYDLGKSIMVSIEHLHRYNKTLVVVQCDVCGTIKQIPYCTYINSIQLGGYYCCSHCNHIKQSQTMLSRYGVKFPCQYPEFREKQMLSCIEKYGVPYTMQSLEVREKANKTLCENGNQKISKQQLWLHKLYGGVLNYPISRYSADICFLEEKIVLEYDGGGHNLCVVTGRETIEEFNRKELIRDKVVKNEGYKIIRIISLKDFLPSDQILLRMLSDAKQYFSKYPNHSWIEFNIDSTTIRNAENKDGITYNYGKLRKIKDSDLYESAV